MGVREATYHALIRPTVEYASAAWDPYLATDINRLEQVQRRGAHFVHRNYWETPSCVSRMIADLGWQSREERRLIHRLTLLYQIQRGLIYILINSIGSCHLRRSISSYPLVLLTVHRHSFNCFKPEGDGCLILLTRSTVQSAKTTDLFLEDKDEDDL